MRLNPTGILRRLVVRRNQRRRRWEAVCSQCGLCCYQKRYRHGRLVIDLSAPCMHLDGETKRCKVYEDRFRVCPDCKKVTLYHAMLSGLMPSECAYVQKYRKLKFLIPKAKIYDPWSDSSRHIGGRRNS